jgi:hypothetical protein
VSKEVAALLLTALVHIVGAGVLVWGMLDGKRPDWRALWPRDDDGGGGGPGGDPAPRPTRPSGGLPLPDAAPAPVRLREPGRLADLHPARRERRPLHPPVPERETAPER